MNSKERVFTTINHQQPDRVPIGEWGIDHDHVSAILGRHSYWRNRRDTTIALWQGRRDEVVEGMKKDLAKLVEVLDYDIIPVELVPPKSFICKDPPKKVDENTWQDKAGNIYKYTNSNDSIVRITAPAAKESIPDSEIDELIKSVADFDETRFEVLDFAAEQFGRDKAVVFRDLSVNSTLFGPFGGSREHQLLLTALAPDELKKMADYSIAYNCRLIEHCAKKDVSITMIGDDYGGSHSCMISPASFR